MCEIVVCDKVVRDKGVCERMVWIQVGSMLDACWIRLVTKPFNIKARTPTHQPIFN